MCLHSVFRATITGALFACFPFVEAQTRPVEANAPSKRVLQLGDRVGSLEYPSGWSARYDASVHELWNLTPEQLAKLSPQQHQSVARIEMTLIPCVNHAEALRRLREIAAEWGTTPQYVALGAWPALQRRQLVPKPRPGKGPNTDIEPAEQLMMITTAVAMNATLVRLDGFAPETAPSSVLDQIESISRSLHPSALGDPTTTGHEVQQLRNSAPLQMPAAAPPASALRTPATANVSSAKATSTAEVDSSTATTSQEAVDLGAANLDLDLGSESEIAVSTDGKNIVVGQQCSFANSTNGGATFHSGFSPGNCTGGDSSVAFGKSGNFYWANIGSNNATCPPMASNCNNTQQMHRSVNNGQTFSFVTNVIDCRAAGANCGFGSVPDQEHIAADRFNASGSGGDQVYLVFRKGFGYGIQCSTDSGANWTAVSYHTGGSIDFPRITVSQNGAVFVTTNNGNNINLDSFSSCASGLVQNLNQVAIATGINQVACPVAGLDRCNDGNTLSSHTVAVDDTNANHLYAAYAVNTAAGNPGNENVLVQDSTDGGATWTRPTVQVNQSLTGRRYEPWVCSVGGIAQVSWYDRRATSALNAASNDLTDYFRGSAFVNSMAGNLVVGTEFQINDVGTADPQCASGWPCLTRSPNDSESCSVQPQFAGTCRHTPNNNMDSNARCDFSGPDATVCPTGETCQGGGGCPKYGDYNGNTCAAGRLYMAWASATSPSASLPQPAGISLFFSSVRVVASGDLNGDGRADCADLAIVRAAFGKASGQAGFDPRADVNNDGVVNLKDLAFVAQKVPAGTICP